MYVCVILIIISAVIILMDTPANIRNLIIQHHNDGKKQREIGRIFNLHHTTVGRIVKQQQASGSTAVKRRGKCGRPQALSDQAQRLLKRTCQVAPHLTAREVQQCAGGDAVNVSINTIKRSLRRSGLFTYRPVPAPLLNPARKRQRFNWANQYAIWGVADWANVVFSDETTIEIGTHRALYVRRGRGTRIRELQTTQRRAYTIKVMFWGCMSGQGLGSLVAIDGTINAAKYVDLLTHHLIPQINAFPNHQLIFQQDNAPSHTAILVREFLQANNVEVLPWPPYSPDMNCIENLWAVLKRKVQQRPHGSREALIAAAQDVWQNDEELRENAIAMANSMPRRIEALRRARGGPTGY